MWETETNLILMLTRLFENQTSKCEKYWPNEGFEEEFGSFYIANEEEINHKYYMERNFKVTNRHNGKSKQGIMT